MWLLCVWCMVHYIDLFSLCNVQESSIYEYASETMTYHDATTIYYIILTVWIHWIITCDIVILLHRFQQMQHLVVFKHQAMPRTAPRFIKYNLMRSLHEQEQWLDCRLSRHIETMQLFDAGNGWKWCNLRGKISGFCAHWISRCRMTKEYYDRQHDSLCGVYVVSSCQFPMLPIPRYQPGGPRMKEMNQYRFVPWTPYVTALLIVTNALHALNALTSGFRGK